ncbi:MAG: HEPN domain-containing protein [Candidatus Schekmanbacteria bacterium]|nr:HEPN domain-containing protein [Candidatus Schekmanbacteria bacterium]
MDTQQIIQYWLKTSEDDIRVAQHLYEAKDYPQALFFGHLFLEKILKALVVQATGEHAPGIHKLLRLANLAGLELTESQKEFLLKVTAYNIEGRYPDELLSVKDKYSETYCREELNKIKELVQWLKTGIR